MLLTGTIYNNPLGSLRHHQPGRNENTNKQNPRKKAAKYIKIDQTVLVKGRAT